MMHSASPSAPGWIRATDPHTPKRRRSVALRRPFLGLLLAVLVGCSGMVPAAAAQEAAARHTLLLRGVPLADALRQLVVTTHLDLSFDPALVEDRRTYCVVEDEPVEVLLRCVLRGTGLDYFRLSSGLYVLTEAAAAPPQFGTLQGIVVDDETGEPLAFAHVLLADGQLGTVANETGRFMLADLLPGTYALTTSYLGYRHRIDSVYVPPRGMARARVPLRSEPVAVSPIVVDGLQSRLPSDSLGAEGLAAGRLARGAGGRAPDVARGLGTLVGVRLDHATADLHVQGGEAGEHQFHLDGAPVFVPVSVGGLVGPFSPFALGRVTVHKTGFGAAFGSQTAGLVQAEHALGPMAGRRLDLQADPLSLNARLGWRTGTPGAVEGSFLAAGRYGLWDLHAPGAVRHLLDDWNRTDPFMLAVFSGSDSDAPTRPERPSFLRDFDGFTTGAPGIGFHDLHGAVRLRMGTLRSLYASTYHSRRTLESNRADDFFDLRADAASDFLDAAAAPPARDFYTWSNSTSQVRYETVLGPRLLARVQARASRYRLAHDYGVHTIEESGLGQATFRYEHLDDNGNRIGEYALGATLDLAATDRWHVEAGAEPVHTASRFLVQGTLRLPIRHQSSGWRVASFLTNRIALTPTLSLDAGTRLTYVAARQRAYLEPRLALRLDRPGGALGPWSLRLASGLYRQYVQQFDVSSRSPRALLSTNRTWLAVDSTVSPPHAAHGAAEVVVQPTRGLTLRAEAYYRRYVHALAIDYTAGRPAFDPVSDGAAGGVSSLPQSAFLAAGDGAAYGAAAVVEKRWEGARAEVRYERGRSRRSFGRLFDGSAVPAPWEEPHRVELAMDWQPAAGLTVLGRWHGVWGRTWGFRQGYYDFLGAVAGLDLRNALSEQLALDVIRQIREYRLAHPEEHRLPPIYQLDLSVAYARRLGGPTLQTRLDLLNVFDRDNVADWRFGYDPALFSAERLLLREERLLLPFTPALAVRVAW